MSKKVILPREVLEVILESARRLHPKETVLLLRGKAKQDSISISELLIPPLAVYGRGFSAFPAHMLPMDFSIIGAVHSHPSGNLNFSVTDLNNSMGKMILIVASPYKGKDNAAAYNRVGEKLILEVT